MRIKIIFLIGLVLLYDVNETFSQIYAKKKDFLIDSLDLSKLSKDDLLLLEKYIRKCNKSESDTSKINIINEFIEACTNDYLWPKYNELIYKLAIDNQNNGSLQITTFHKKSLANVLINRAFIQSNNGEYDLALINYKKALNIVKELNIKEEIYNYQNSIGYIYKIKGSLALAAEYFTKALVTAKELNKQNYIAYTYGRFGEIYLLLGKTSMALDAWHKAYKTFAALGNLQEMSTTLNNIGIIHSNLRNETLALSYFNKSLTICKKNNDDNGIQTVYNNFGKVYAEKGKNDLALAFYFKSIKILEKLNDRKNMIVNLINIGDIYLKQKKNELALGNYNKALRLSEEFYDKYKIIYSLIAIGKLDLMELRIADAQKKGNKALKMAKEIGYIKEIKQATSLLYAIALKQNKWKEALTLKNIEIQLLDSLSSIGQVNDIASQQAKFEYEQAKTISDAEQAKKDIIVKQEAKFQRVVIYAIATGLCILLLFLYILFKRYKYTQKQKETIEEQKRVVEQKQKEILDSISYAKRIQQAMLTSKKYITENFNADFFIFYKPKDIVSGDFYWTVAQHNKFYIVTADCTGHGVPGAFMSLLNINFLNENVIERKIEDPSYILNEQRKNIIKALNPSGNENSKDGMDCTICAFDLVNLTLECAMANNPIWIIRNQELLAYNPDKMPVGLFEITNKDFTKHTIKLKKDDLVYTFTDGYADQFGGPNNKKFKYQKLKELLLNNASLPMHEQEKLIETTFNDWKNKLEQVDDVLIIGVRI